MEELKECTSSTKSNTKNQGGMNPCMRRPTGQNSTEEKAAKILVSSSVAEKVVGNEDLLTEILSRLPTKPLFRFKLVSKNWLSLISNPRLYLLLKPKPTSGLLMSKFMQMDNPDYNANVFNFIPLDSDEQCEPVSKTMRSLDFIKEPVQILQSCNGLLLCRSPRFHPGDFPDSKYYICNPLTKRFTVLPRPPGWSIDGMMRDMNLAADVSEPTQYKVVAFSLLSANRKIFQIEIYSSVTRAWRLIGETLEADDFRYNSNGGVFWNSAILWQSRYFNVDKECTGLMPVRTKEQRFGKYFGESNGHLHLVYFDFSEVWGVVVLEMESDYSNWFVKYSFDLESVTTQFRGIQSDQYGLLEVISLVRRENEEESFLVLYIFDEFISINFASGICQKLCDLQLSERDIDELVTREWRTVHQYIETPFWV